MTPNDRKFSSLDGIRGVAALAVVVFHAGSFFGPKLSLPNGHLAVDLFFVLSGFVITYVYGERLDAGMSVWAFMRSRLIRLYPLYLLGTLLGLCFSVLGERSILSTLGIAPFALMMLPSPTHSGTGAIFRFNYVAWSLLSEVLINFVFAVLWKCLRQPWVLLFILVVSGYALCLAGWAYGTLNLGWDWGTVAPGSFRVIYSFSAGVLIYKLRSRIAWQLPVPSFLWLLLVILIFHIHYFGESNTSYQLICILGVFPLMVLFASTADVNPLFGRLYFFLGFCSYGIYILHLPITLALRNRAPWMSEIAPVSGILWLFIMLIVAYIATKYFETPLRRFLAKKFQSTLA